MQCAFVFWVLFQYQTHIVVVMFYYYEQKNILKWVA